MTFSGVGGGSKEPTPQKYAMQSVGGARAPLRICGGWKFKITVLAFHKMT